MRREIHVVYERSWFSLGEWVVTLTEDFELAFDIADECKKNWKTRYARVETIWSETRQEFEKRKSKF